ncbi:hypothetical protein Tco_0523438 [Tanacetum coccineum]
MDTFLKLPAWTGTVVNKGDPLPKDQRPKPRVTPPLPVGTAIPALTPFQKNLEKPNPKIVAARERKDQQNLAKAEAKRACAGTTGGPEKKRRVQKHIEPPQSGLEGTLSATTIHQAIPETTQKPAIIASEVSPDVEKEVVDLSGNTRVSSPPVMNVQSSPHQEHHGTHESMLRNDLRVCTFRACKELVSHLATPAKDEFLGALSNVELDHPRSSARRTEQENEGLNNKLSLIRSAHSGCESREKELMDADQSLEGEKLALSAELARAEVDRQKLVREFIPAVVKRLHTSVEYRQALAAPGCATLPGVSPDAPTPRPASEIPGSAAEQTDDTALKPPPPNQETAENVPFGTTT